MDEEKKAEEAQGSEAEAVADADATEAKEEAKAE